MSFYKSLLNLPAGLLETGLMVTNTTAQTMEGAVNALTGRKNDTNYTETPVHGPQNLDAAVSDFANRLVRIGHFSPPHPDYATLVAEVVASARRSFGFLRASDPGNLVLPLTLPLSATSMLAQSALRMLAAYSTVGGKQLPLLMDNAVETLSEAGIFVGLEYKDLIDRYRERLKHDPDDKDATLELGRTLMKCGLWDQALAELDKVAQDPAFRARARHSAAIALYRAGRFEQALQACLDSMNSDSTNERARVWMWFSAQKIGGYPENVPADFRMEMKPGWDSTDLQYEDIAAKIGLDKTSAGRGTAIFDYNNDGLLDIVITAAHGGCSLYRNNGDGTFTDVSVGSGLDECVNAFAIAAGDYDNDGFTDLFITRLGFYNGDAVLYHNNGDGTFTDVTAKAGVQSWGPAFTASWADYDCDGHLDLLICHNLAGVFDRQVPNRLFHNNGDGTFTEVTEKCGLSSPYPTVAAAWGDYRNSGYPDVFLSSGLGRPLFFRNNGDGTFTDISQEAGFEDFAMGSMCFSCDYDNDGRLDIVQYTWVDHEDEVYTMKTGKAREGGLAARVYRNNGDGTFTMRNVEIGLDQGWGTMSGSFGDLNNDGSLDLILGNGSPRMERLNPMIIFESDGQRFRNTTFAAGLPFVGKSHGVNCGDLFGDGRLEIIVAAGGVYPGDLLTSSVYRPTQRLGNYVNVRLTGVKSNRDAIGARLTLRAGGAQQMREVFGGTNFGCLPCEQHFGLGTLKKVDALEIRWPSGASQVIENPPVNDTIRITEGQPGWEQVYKNLPVKSKPDLRR
jgi:tetratricopeptide (TPR) repeat protein